MKILFSFCNKKGNIEAIRKDIKTANREMNEKQADEYEVVCFEEVVSRVSRVWWERHNLWGYGEL